MTFRIIMLGLLIIWATLSPALAKTDFPGVFIPPAAVLKKGQPAFREVQVLNEATDRHSRMFLLDNVQVPIGAPVPLGQTVKEDLERYLSKRVAVDPAASRRLTVTLQKAEAYWVLPLDEKVLLDSFDLQNRRPDEREFILELKALFEVREAGRVAKSYLWEKKVSLPDGRVEFPGEIRESYERLLERYRKVFFEALEKEFWGGL